MPVQARHLWFRGKRTYQVVIFAEGEGEEAKNRLFEGLLAKGKLGNWYYRIRGQNKFRVKSRPLAVLF